MAYHPLARESGSDADNRMAEARRIVKMLASVPLIDMTIKEIDFVKDMSGATICTVKQLFWLRDIKDKYL